MLSPSSVASCISITRKAATPRAIAVILGPLGASKSLLERLADQLYADCTIVAAASPPFRFMLHRSMRNEAREVLEVTSQLMQEEESEEKDSPPLIVHSFSNGGCFLLDEMEQILSSNDDGDEDTRSLELVRSKLRTGCQIFDSCPCYIRMAWDWKDDVASSFPHPNWSPTGRWLYTMGAAWALTTWCTATLAVSHPHQFWTRRLESRCCLHHVYIYSTCDMLSDAAAVDRLIAYRKQRNQQAEAINSTASTTTTTTTDVYRYDDSDHCRLHVDHPEDYQAILHRAIAQAKLRHPRAPS